MQLYKLFKITRFCGSAFPRFDFFRGARSKIGAPGGILLPTHSWVDTKTRGTDLGSRKERDPFSLIPKAVFPDLFTFVPRVPRKSHAIFGGPGGPAKIFCPPRVFLRSGRIREKHLYDFWKRKIEDLFIDPFHGSIKRFSFV